MPWWGPFVLLQLVLLQIIPLPLFDLIALLWFTLGVVAVIGVASDPLKQGWHDKLGGALVIGVRAAPSLVIAERT
jgi:uncharacterized RDD family membrane protein YckC